jgi:hypothetical protein
MVGALVAALKAVVQHILVNLAARAAQVAGEQVRAVHLPHHMAEDRAYLVKDMPVVAQLNKYLDSKVAGAAEQVVQDNLQVQHEHLLAQVV